MDEKDVMFFENESKLKKNLTFNSKFANLIHIYIYSLIKNTWMRIG